MEKPVETKPLNGKHFLFSIWDIFQFFYFSGFLLWVVLRSDIRFRVDRDVDEDMLVDLMAPFIAIILSFMEIVVSFLRYNGRNWDKITLK